MESQIVVNKAVSNLSEVSDMVSEIAEQLEEGYHVRVLIVKMKERITKGEWC